MFSVLDNCRKFLMTCPVQILSSISFCICIQLCSRFHLCTFCFRFTDTLTPWSTTQVLSVSLLHAHKQWRSPGTGKREASKPGHALMLALNTRRHLICSQNLCWLLLLLSDKTRRPPFYFFSCFQGQCLLELALLAKPASAPFYQDARVTNRAVASLVVMISVL